MTDEEFLKKLEKCTAGYNFWKGIVNKYKLSAKDYVIAFPHEKDPVNECGIVHLKQFMEYGEKKRILILCVGNEVVKILDSKMVDTSIRIEVLTSEEMESLITLYSISTISSHFLMMSLTKPYGRYGDRVLKEGFVLDEVVTIGIYNMSENEVFESATKTVVKGDKRDEQY